jgi:hypothetical protein
MHESAYLHMNRLGPRHLSRRTSGRLAAVRSGLSLMEVSTDGEPAPQEDSAAWGEAVGEGAG